MGQVTTDDGVRISFVERGDGPPLVLLPGWAQTAEMFRAQLDGLSDRYRVIAIDHRGHGESEEPGHGYRITRLAADVESVLDQLSLERVHLLGWSMGSTVAWAYYDLFGPDRLDRLVLVDQPPVFIRRPSMTDEEALDVGAFLDFAGAVANDEALRADPVGFVTGFERLFLTRRFDALDWLVSQSLKTPPAVAADLLVDLVLGDWRDVCPRISVPTLVIGAGRSHIPVRSQRWLAQVIPDCRLSVYDELAHLMFFEEPESFNALVRDFLG